MVKHVPLLAPATARPPADPFAAQPSDSLATEPKSGLFLGSSAVPQPMNPSPARANTPLYKKTKKKKKKKQRMTSLPETLRFFDYLSRPAWP